MASLLFLAFWSEFLRYARAGANLHAPVFTSWERNAIITGDLGSMFLFGLKAFDPFRGDH